jgi:hypothetical protein
MTPKELQALQREKINKLGGPVSLKKKLFQQNTMHINIYNIHMYFIIYPF